MPKASDLKSLLFKAGQGSAQAEPLLWLGLLSETVTFSCNL